VRCGDAGHLAPPRGTPQGDYDGFLQAVVALVAEADAALGRSDAAIGIALPGVRDRRSGRQLSANVPALTGQCVAQDLQARLQRPLHFGNDLQCFALSEAHGGAADGYPSMFGAILGTGAGGGFCLQGRLLSGFNGLAGEWGHWSVPGHLLQRHGLPLLDCACGLQGCVERYVSGSGVAMIERHLGGSAARRQRGDRPGRGRRCARARRWTSTATCSATAWPRWCWRWTRT
jgi:N-acetylglucosamine kinase